MVSTTIKFRPGDMVQVRTGSPPTHFRTPEYIQGKQGRVDALCGLFPNPESLAYGGTGLPYVPLYRIKFAQNDIWHHYPGPATEQLLVDIYEHWLDPTNEPAPRLGDISEHL